MTFWILIAVMALAVTGLLLLALLRTRSGQTPAAAYDLQVYRDQLKGVDRDLARGVIAEGDAERIRTEISRRILAADAQMQAEVEGGGQPRTLTTLVAGSVAAIIVVGAFFIYRDLGAPGYGDLPLSLRVELAQEARENRPDQARAEERMPAIPKPELDPGYAELIEQLRETVKKRPDDLQGQVLLAQHEANSGNHKAAYEAKARVIEILGAQASAQDYAEQAEMMILAAGGYVSPQAEAVLETALERDPRHGPARYYYGLSLSQTGRPDIAFRIWEETLRESPSDAPWVPAIRSQIVDLAFRAGVDYRLPETPGLAGPSAEDIEAAGDMNAEEVQDMARGMVERLSERLANEGGSPPEWARLIQALGVLGDTDRARAIYAEAQQVFGNDANAVALLQAAARAAGIDG
ncbi:c-type cytochrome biogenesis protein CcmI [Tropicibacter sp. R16_0]|uniref:c-type cytochrome biogenesis protein CcmI n=1 Tax=Tropicibacter sp. R16_0 TaxID=2821102 RepID=UPI001ADCD710|nr:c-type cytochrome biogenesis protein CcmI [Tropicibacter sp. R16_0]MBO9452027.1 c-type cytochrome biogenesis protein CcmI [Tropicibacter sp. R16_0]